MVKKIVLIVIGLFALLGGLLIAGVGVAALALGGRSGTILSGYHHVSTTTSALVSDPARIRHDTNVDFRSGSATLRIDARETPKNLFIGVGPADQVTAYLAGTSYEVVSDLSFSPFRLTTGLVPGTATPAAPADQTFWVAQASGSQPSLSWPIAGGDYRVVVMNSDGSRLLATDARVGIKVPALFGLGLGSTIVGGLIALLGVGLLIWGIAARRKVAVVAPVPVYPPAEPRPGWPYQAIDPYGAGGPYRPTGGGPPAPAGPFPPTYTPSTPSAYPGRYPGDYPGEEEPPYRPPAYGADPTADPGAPNRPTSGTPSGEDDSRPN